MVDWSSWRGAIYPHVPGAPWPLIQDALIVAARQFFDESKTWRQWFDAFEINSADPSGPYRINIPSGADCLMIELATKDGKFFPVHSFAQADSDPELYSAGQPQGLIPSPGSFATFWLSGQVPPIDSIRVRTLLIPSRNSAGLPDSLANQYRDSICDGAIAALMLTPGTAFFNPDLSGVHQAKFNSAINRHAVRSFMGNTKDTPRQRIAWC